MKLPCLTIFRWVSIYIFFSSTPLIVAAQIFVNSAAGGLNNGTSWANGFTDLQSALAVAGPGDEIWVRKGTYNPTVCNPCGVADRSIAFNIPSDIALYGGFNGTETSLVQRDWEANATILSGDIGVALDSLDNSYRVMITENVSENTFIDGFTIEEANADGSFATQGEYLGGGLYNDANPGGISKPQIRHCIFRNNFAGAGGAVANDAVLGGEASPIFRYCTFEGNAASLGNVSSTGGAVMSLGNSGALIEPQFIGCTFSNNLCGNDGGAISGAPSGAGSIYGGLIDSCVFINNRAYDRGGAIWTRMSAESVSRMVVSNTRFEGNQSGLNLVVASQDGSGGAVYHRASFDGVRTDTFENCVFVQNETLTGEGGAIFFRGSQVSTLGTGGINQPVLINCVFDRNVAATNGGAIGTVSYFGTGATAGGECSPEVINCTFSGNTAPGNGGAIYQDGSGGGLNNVTITNSILWNNVSGTGEHEVHLNTATAELSYSDIQGGIPAGVTDNGNNLNVDPLFVDGVNGDLHLSIGSPLMDIGDNAAVPAAVLYDVDRDQRIMKGAVDLGAYEGGILYVDLTATGADDGSSWNNAFIDLQDALSFAKGGDEVWVAQSTYNPTVCNPCGVADRSIAFNIPSDIALYGGFNGTETSLVQRDWEANATILSGDIGVALDSLDNSYRVMITENVSENTFIDGFTIEEANADGSFATQGEYLGGGLYNDANPGGISKPQIRHCIFRNNFAGAGGAVANDAVLGGEASPIFRYCTFEGNAASLGNVSSTGGAVMSLGNSGALIEPQFIGCTFSNNLCGNDGGAISGAPSGAGSIYGGLIDSCVFINNRAYDRGGAIWTRMSAESVSRMVVSNTRFEGNQSGLNLVVASQDGSGGAVYHRASFDGVRTDTFENCVFVQNETLTGEGGAIFFRGSQVSTLGTGGINQPVLINCVFDRNVAATNGGAIGTVSYFGTGATAGGECSPEVINCTFSGNTAPGNGGAIYQDGSGGGLNNVTITNSILWNNVSGTGEHEVHLNTATAELSYSDIQGGIPVGVTDNGNNLNVDPLFADMANGDFTLLKCSPAHDMGDNSQLPADVDQALSGEVRIFSTNIDMGAYEYQANSPNDAPLINDPDVMIVADDFCIAEDGWIHYFSDANDRLLLSIHPDRQSIGRPSVTAGTSRNYGNFFATNIGAPYAAQFISWQVINRYWNVSRASQTANPVSVRFYYDEQDFFDLQGSNSLLRDEREMNMYTLSVFNPDPDLDHGNATDREFSLYNHHTRPSLQTWIQGTFNGRRYGEFLVSTLELGGGAGAEGTVVLPVELLNISAMPLRKEILVSWTTASELNHAGFWLEKSVDGETFVQKEWIPAKGSHHEQKQYDYVDEKVFKDTVYYYRLRQIDLDGKEAFSQIVEAELGQADLTQNIRLFPNPVSDYLYINYPSESAQAISIFINNGIGQKVYEKEYKINKGNNRLTIPVSHFSKGYYQLRIRSIHGDFLEKIMFAN